jgi:CDP-6-deoxy-D-xylo-4-hexulose-3-dehydrase
MSTIEGGMVCTDDEDLYHILLSIRSHGWDRDLPKEKQQYLRDKYNISDFRALYTFYYPGFNLRATDLQAFIGIEQLKKLPEIVKNRNINYLKYQEGIINQEWKITAPLNSFISNFAYPVVTKNIDMLIKKLNENNIDCRPLICGSINEHPFWYERYGKNEFPIAKKIHEYGLYIPNNHQMTDKEINKIIKIINKYV